MTVPAGTQNEHPERSTKVVVPEAQVVCVGFPGHVNDSERALDLLGGSEVVANTLKQPSMPLKCRPRKADGFSHPIFSSAASSNRVLLEVKKFTGADGSVAFQVSTVARIATTHEFSGPADFQIVSSTLKPIPPDTIPPIDPNSPLTAEPTRRPHPLLCLPPMFTRSDATFPYRFRAFMRRTTRSELQWLPKSKVESVAWEGPTPPMPPLDDPSFVKVHLDSPGVVGAVGGLFEERPGWLLPAMHDRFMHGSPAARTFQKAAVDSALACMAYRFSQGAFQGVLFQKGFDPRMCADAWALQALPCALPDTWKGSPVHHALDAAAAYTGTAWQPPPETPRTSMAPLATTYAQLVTLRHIPPSKMSFVQVCDIWSDERVCAPLWGAIGAPPNSQPRWGPHATAAGTPPPQPHTQHKEQGADAGASRGALEHGGDTHTHTGTATAADAGASTSAAGGGNGDGASDPAAVPANPDGGAAHAPSVHEGGTATQKCLEHSGWFLRGPWDAACQRAARVLCGMLPTALPGTRKVFSQGRGWGLTDPGGSGGSGPGSLGGGAANDAGNAGMCDNQSSKGGGSGSGRQQKRLGALPARARRVTPPAAAAAAPQAAAGAASGGAAGKAYNLTNCGSGGAAGGFQDRAEEEVRTAQAAVGECSHIQSGSFRAAVGGGADALPATAPCAASAGDAGGHASAAGGGGVTWQDAFVQISRQIREEHADDADVNEPRPEEECANAAQLDTAVAAMELEAAHDHDEGMMDI